MSSGVNSSRISLLCEASEEDLVARLELFFERNDVQEWKVLNVLEDLFVVYKPTSSECLSLVKRTLKRFASNYNSNDARLNKAMKTMYNNCDKVLASSIAKQMISRQRVEQLNSLYHSCVAESVIEDKTEMVQSTSSQITAMQPTKPSSVMEQAASTTATTSTQSSSKRGLDKSSSSTPQKKKVRRLSAKDLNTLTLNKQLECLASELGTNNILDLTTPGLVPQRLACVIKRLDTDLGFGLKLAYTLGERKILMKICKSATVDELEPIAKSISLTPTNNMRSYLYIALSKLILLYQSNLLVDTTHKEGWYQGHVYADLFDAVFLYDSYYTTKRTECHASTVKFLRKTRLINQNEKDAKVDMILFNDKLGDIFCCEDKPADAKIADVEADLAKARDLREKRLKYIQATLPFPSCIKYIEVLSAQFYGLLLTVYGSRMTDDGVIVHYQKATATIPSQATFNMTEIAHFLLTVMSLQRAIVINFKKLIAIYESCMQDSVHYLATSFDSINNSIFYRDDSPVPSNISSTDSSQNDVEDNLMELEQSRRVMELIEDKIKKIGHTDDVLTCDNWEDIINDD
ncbi:hypothetical protein MBANPS3_012407 [Mucor bainieri]